MPNNPVDTQVDSLGRCTIPSPVPYRRFVDDNDRILRDLEINKLLTQDIGSTVTFERAGPRQQLFFDPKNVKAAIVTCGGLCPGLNDVIRAITNELTYMYGVRHIKGVRFGYAGLNPNNGLPFIDLTPELVEGIHDNSGSILGSSRGPQPIDVMVDTLYREDIRILYTIGGDGTLQGATEIYEEIKKRGLNISVIGIPKTIDNDIYLVSRTFGFDTAVAKAAECLRCAHTEAKGYQNGIGIVKLMGRSSGFVTASAALAQPDANFVLIPEVPFEFDGPKGFLTALENRMKRRGHALVVVAEGAGQDLFADLGSDASGNKKFGDIGILVRDKVREHFKRISMDVSIKYIDPSYMIRSVPACPSDCVFCLYLGQHAAHAGMAGKTGMMIGSWNDEFIHIPFEAVHKKRKYVDPEGIMWTSVLETTGQPERMVND